MKKSKQLQKPNFYNLRESPARIEQALCKQASMNTQKVNTKDNPTLINYMQGTWFSISDFFVPQGGETMEG